MKWNEMKWNEMKWNEMKWNEMKWNEMKWNEMNELVYKLNWFLYTTVVHFYGASLMFHINIFTRLFDKKKPVLLYY